MVDKNLDLVARTTFSDADDLYSDKQMESIYEEIYETEGFNDADLLVLTGGPTEKEESDRRESLVEYIEEFSGNWNELPVLLTTPSQKISLDEEGINDSNYILHLMEPESSLDEITRIEEELEEENQKTVVFTSDYHVPRYEKRLNSAFSSNWEDPRGDWLSTFEELVFDPDHGDPTNDYLILGAETFEDESQYGQKWVSELVRTALPQKLKDKGKKYISD